MVDHFIKDPLNPPTGTGLLRQRVIGPGKSDIPVVGGDNGEDGDAARIAVTVEVHDAVQDRDLPVYVLLERVPTDEPEGRLERVVNETGAGVLSDSNLMLDQF